MIAHALSVDAVVKRVNRRLARESWLQLKKSRGWRMRQEVGDYYVLDWNRNFVVRKYVDPAEFARELGVLGEFESVTEAEED
jgi:hypothetical protein